MLLLKVVFTLEGRDGAITCRKLIRIRPWNICLCFLESVSIKKNNCTYSQRAPYLLTVHSWYLSSIRKQSRVHIWCLLFPAAFQEYQDHVTIFRSNMNSNAKDKEMKSHLLSSLCCSKPSRSWVCQETKWVSSQVGGSICSFSSTISILSVSFPKCIEFVL